MIRSTLLECFKKTGTIKSKHFTPPRASFSSCKHALNMAAVNRYQQTRHCTFNLYHTINSPSIPPALQRFSDCCPVSNQEKPPGLVHIVRRERHLLDCRLVTAEDSSARSVREEVLSHVHLKKRKKKLQFCCQTCSWNSFRWIFARGCRDLTPGSTTHRCQTGRMERVKWQKTKDKAALNLTSSNLLGARATHRAVHKASVWI